MVIIMLTNYNTIHIGEAVHYNVKEVTWKCYLNYFRWLYKQGIATPVMFQSGWAVKVNG